MASLYDIDAAIMALVDPDTGEISDWAEFDALQMERERKIENVACWYKNLIAEAKMLKDEETALKARREAVERSAEKRLPPRSGIGRLYPVGLGTGLPVTALRPEAPASLFYGLML